MLLITSHIEGNYPRSHKPGHLNLVSIDHYSFSPHSFYSDDLGFPYKLFTLHLDAVLLPAPHLISPTTIHGINFGRDRAGAVCGPSPPPKDGMEVGSNRIFLRYHFFGHGMQTSRLIHMPLPSERGRIIKVCLLLFVVMPSI
ncbi:unnamed protein product [Protopolystoma xenopodis]|uniref:Uncharacterized protein n=1 Tax=Protopolystoma xenopodis TaxID=117903 RepID=A0A448WZE0_9PLAT|nr:unnamed protein product [Protopolystoma xenopodis]